VLHVLNLLQRAKAVFRYLKEQQQQSYRTKEKDQASLEKTVRVFQEEIQALKIENREVMRCLFGLRKNNTICFFYFAVVLTHSPTWNTDAKPTCESIARRARRGAVNVLRAPAQY
jgi:hypothetical protein